MKEGRQQDEDGQRKGLERKERESKTKNNNKSRKIDALECKLREIREKGRYMKRQKSNDFP